MQGLIHVFQHLAHSVVNLLLGLVYAAVEYRENIILVRMVGFGVFADNRFRLLREVAGHLLAGFVAGIVDSFLVHVAVTQGAMSLKLMPAERYENRKMSRAKSR